MGLFNWFKKTVQRNENTRISSPMSQCGLNNESYRNALQQFIDRRRLSNEVILDTDLSICQSNRTSEQFSVKDSNKKREQQKCLSIIPGVPHIQASEIFEIGCIAGTEDRYLELYSAEWQNSRVSFKRHAHPECREAIKMELEILTEIRHPNVLLLMATTNTDEHGLISIFESIDCTLYNYMHEQGERMSLQNIAQNGMKLAETLKYCHMRGYIHGTISSHCIYLTSSGVIKLGGWELGITQDGNVERDYEKRLRTETFKWQAPEFFYGLNPSKQSDVYGLTLLLWEMSTMRVPWSGCSQPYVEQQYVSRKRGVAMDLHNFPPLLYNLLETGLQLDITQRTLDMDKMCRTLHRLLMMYETEEAMYITEYGNNNNDAKDTYILSISRTSPASPINHMALIKKPSNKLQCIITGKKFSNQFLQSKKIQCNRDLELENDIEKTDRFVRENSTVNEVQNTPCCNCNCVKISELQKCESDENSFSTARSNLKRLKEAIANKRENFFNGNDESFSSNITASPKTPSTVTSQVANNRNYVTCKPASHATTIEPNYSRSPNKYDGPITKLSQQQLRKSSYMNVSENIKNAMIQRQALDSSSESFYESTFWKKEKLICLSKMRRNSDEYKQLLPSTLGSNNVTSNADKSKAHCNPVLVKGNHAEDAKELISNDLESSHALMIFSTPPSSNKHIRNLKDALDRATDIVRSTPPGEKHPFSRYKTYCDIEVSTDKIQEYESVFEDLYGTKHNGDQEIKTIERSTSDSGSFLGINKFGNVKNIANQQKREEKWNYPLINHDQSKHANEFIHKNTAEVLNKSETLLLNQGLKNSQEMEQNKTALRNRIMLTPQNNRITAKDIQLNRRASIDKGYVSTLSSSLSRRKSCNSYYSGSLRRRRSLPAKLNQLKIMNSPMLGKYLHKADLRDSENTIEDIYIDDEFGSRLNDNLILLDEDDLHLLDSYLFDDENEIRTTEL